MKKIPHTKTGREVKVGDKVVSVSHGYLTAGTVLSINEGMETCNAQIVPPGIPTIYVTLSECVHAEDLADFKE